LIAVDSGNDYWLWLVGSDSSHNQDDAWLHGDGGSKMVVINSGLMAINGGY